MLLTTQTQSYIDHVPEITNQAIDWVRLAGQIALNYFKNSTLYRKADDSFLTRADVEIEEFLSNRIHITYPDHRFIGEEGTRNQINLPTPYTWVIDPIDGTTAFVQGLSGWGISLGLLYAGQPILGIFYMPLLDDLTYATVDDVYCNDQSLKGSIRQTWANKGFLAVNAGAHLDFEIEIPRIRALGSISANLVYTARGSAVATLITRSYLWDLVAGALIMNQAGGELRYLSGAPLQFTSLLDGRLAPEPIIAGCSAILDDLQTRIKIKRSLVKK